MCYIYCVIRTSINLETNNMSLACKVRMCLMSTLLVYSVQVQSEVQSTDLTSSKNAAHQSLLTQREQPILISRQVRSFSSREEEHDVGDTFLPTVVSILEDLPYSGPCSLQYCSKETTVNCAGLSLKEVKSTWFPRNTTVILLDNNDVQVVDNVSFSHLNDLRVLSLSNNNIKNIQQNAFRGLEHLETLNLEYNRLTEASYPPGLFDPLVSLTDLRLRYNQETSNLPDSLFASLKNLNSLAIDANGDTFSLGNEFSNLTKLVLSGNIKILDTESFENVQHIEHLVVEDVPSLFNFTDTALQPLHHLDAFTLASSYIGITKSLNALKPLIGRNMTSIDYYRISFSKNEGFSSLIHNEGILNSEKTQYLIQICVRDFSLTRSHIFVVEVNAFVSPLWKKCLKNLNLSANPLMGTLSIFFFLLNFKNIETININNAFRSCYDKKSFSTSSEGILTRESGVSSMIKHLPACDHELLSLSGQDDQYSDKVINRNLKDALSQKQNTKPVMTFSDATDAERTILKLEQKRSFLSSYNMLFPTEQTSSYFVFYFSNSLKYLQCSRVGSGANPNINVVVVGLNNLVSLDLRDNILRNFTGKIVGLDSLQTLILSGNDLSVLAEYFFDGMCNLAELDLSNCQLNTDLFANESARITQNLSQLKRLDLSSNMLYSLKPGTFASNKMLQQLDLSRNRFKNIPFNLKYTPNLKMLDLRENVLPSLEPNERDELNRLANRPGGFNLFISGNILSCGCDSLLFLHWLATTRVRLDIVHNFTCMNNEGQLSYWSISDDLEELWRKCWGKIFLPLAMILLFSMVIGFLSVFVIWKNKTFLWTKLLEIVIGYKQKRREDYQIGVFIAYADKDYKFPCLVLRKYIEDELKLTTYVYHRDMDPSCDAANSIANAINNSWRTILVCTDNFLFNDEWSMFTLKSAVYAQSPANPSRIVVLVHENLEHRLPAEVVSAVSEDNIIVVSEWRLNYSLKETFKIYL